MRGIDMRTYAIKCIDKEWLKSHSQIESEVIDLTFESFDEEYKLTTEDWNTLYEEVVSAKEWFIPYIQIWELTTSLFTEDLVNSLDKVEYGLPKKDYKDIDIPFEYELVIKEETK